MFLLDTCTLLWLMLNQEKLSDKAVEILEHRTDQLFLSSISALEIGKLLEKKRLSLELPLAKWIEQAQEFMRIEEVPITIQIAIKATELDHHHRDPADRIIIATAIENNLTILTPDINIHRYKDAKVVW